MGWTFEWLSFYMQRHPRVFRTLLRMGNELGATPKLFFTRAAQVREIFERPADFQVGYTIAPRSKLGDFLLSMDEGPRHTREKRALARALGLSLVTFRQHAAADSDTLARVLAAAHAGGRIDLGSEFAERVFVRSLAHGFGLPLHEWRSEHLDTRPGEQTLALFIRTLGGTIGMSAPATFGTEQLADHVAPEFGEQLDQVIMQRRSQLDADPLQATDTVLDRLIVPRPGPHEDREQVEQDAQFVQRDGLTRSVAGLLAAGASFPKAFSNVLFELARHRQLGLLADQSRRLAPAAWAELVEAYVLEALRFRPLFPVLSRYCPRATSAAMTPVPAGATLGFAPLAAMFDPAAVERPEVFIAGRPKQTYCIFGAGPRACIGRPLMLALFPPMLRAMFAHFPEIRHMQTGAFRYDGPALEHFWVELPRAARPSVSPDPSPHEQAKRLSVPPPIAATRLPMSTSAPLRSRPSAPPPASSNLDGPQGRT